MANAKRSKSAENYSAQYKSGRKWETNRKRRLERVLKEQPNNEQVKAALKSMVYRRKTPTTAMWSHSWKKTAQLIKQFSGKFDKECMNSDPKKAAEAMRMSTNPNRPKQDPTPAKYDFYSIGIRFNK